MAERDDDKPGFFSRLFGRKPDAPTAPAPVETAPAPPETTTTVTTDSPDRETTPPAPLAGADLQPSEGQDASAETPDDASPGAPAPGREAPEPALTSSPALFTLRDGSGEEAPAAAPQEPKKSWWRRLTEGMKRTSSTLSDRVTSLFTKRKLDSDTLEDLEDALVQADLGVDMATRIAEAVGKGRYDREISPDEVRAILAREVEQALTPVAKPLVVDRSRKPFVILMVGVNGAGKTTTIGKLAAKFRAQNLSVILAAGDTFRAAAIEQLKVWGSRVGAPVLYRDQGADAAGLAFDALTRAKAEGTDILMIDTAGRLQNKAGLMAELEKIIRVIAKVDPQAPHAVLLVLDATVGQNALSQVEIFRQAAGVTGLVMTKLDGTARGGILVALAQKFAVPVHFIGVGEGVDDLEPFTARDFARAIAGLEQG